MCIAQNKYSRSETLYDSALLAYKSNRYKLALNYADSSIASYPQAKSHFLSGLILERIGLDIRALATYSAVLDLSLNHDEARFRRALIYLEYKNPENAIADFNELLTRVSKGETHAVFFRMDPHGAQQVRIQTVAGLQADILHYRGQAKEQLGLFEEAMLDYKEAIMLDPQPDFYVTQSLTLQKMGNKVSAEKSLRRALELEPDHPLAWYNLIVLKEDEFLPDTLILEGEFAPILSLKGTKALHVENMDEALRYFNASLKIDSLDVLTRVNRGRALTKKCMYDLARSDFVKALEINSECEACWYLIGNTYFFDKKYQQSLAYYQKYLTIDPTHAMVWFNAAMALMALEMKEEGCHYLRRSLHFGMADAELHLKKYCNREE